MDSVPFFLVTGFLGCGKTTLLKNFLNSHADSKSIAVIQNEFAPGDVDANDLRQTQKKFKILEINSGSVFCVCLLADFIKSLRDLLDSYSLDAVILEATGLADPIAIGQLLHAPELYKRVYLAHTWSIVDASNFLQMEKTVTRISHQVRVADTVIINKTDKALGDLNKIKSRVKELNPFAEIISTTYCQFSLDKVFKSIKEQPVALQRSTELQQFDPSGRPNIGSAVIRTTSTISRENLDRFLALETPHSYRLKGFVNLADGSKLAVQSCFGDTQFSTVSNYMGPTELIALGPDVEPDRFIKTFYDLL